MQSQKPSNAMMKMALVRVAPGKEDQELLLQQRIRLLVTSLTNHKLSAPQIRNHINISHRSSTRHISTSTVQRRLQESDLYGRIDAKKPLIRNNNTKRIAWARKHKEWILD